MNEKEKIDELRLLMDGRFLATLVEVAKTSGWSFDYEETIALVEWCFEIANTECPGLCPYEFDE